MRAKKWPILKHNKYVLSLLAIAFIASILSMYFSLGVNADTSKVADKVTKAEWIHKGLIKLTLKGDKVQYFTYFDSTGSTERFGLIGGEVCDDGAGNADTANHLKKRPTTYLSIDNKNYASANYLKKKPESKLCSAAFSGEGTIGLNTDNRSLFWMEKGSNEINLWHNQNAVKFKKSESEPVNTGWSELYTRTDEDTQNNPCIDAIGKTSSNQWVLFPMMQWTQDNKNAFLYAEGAMSEGYHFLFSNDDKNATGSYYNECRVSSHRLPNVYNLGRNADYKPTETLSGARDYKFTLYRDELLDDKAIKICKSDDGKGKKAQYDFNDVAYKDNEYADTGRVRASKDSGGLQNNVSLKGDKPPAGHNWVYSCKRNNPDDSDKATSTMRVWDNRGYGMADNSNRRLLQLSDGGLDTWKWTGTSAGSATNDGYLIKSGVATIESIDVDAAKGKTDILTDEPKNPETDDTEPESGTSCNIDGIGWIICPAMNFLAQVNEQAFGYLKSLLNVQPSLLQDGGTTKAWASFRDIANVAFVIAFLVIIYSQITSFGISNYGIKKMLPKIAVAAIMVNLSYFACLLLVDTSNIAGASLYSFITGIVEPLSGTTDSGGLWTTLMTGVLYAGVGILLIVMIITAPIVLLAAAMVLLILIARQAFVLILVIISPLAFVAYLLPNTEDLFKKWWKALSAMLLLYPIIAVVFGASTLASNILMGIASQQGNITAESSDDNQMLAIVALAVMAIPLFAIPTLLKGAMAGAGSIGARLQGLADRTQGRASKSASEGLTRNAESLESKMAARGGMIGAVGGYRARRSFRRKSMEGNTARRQEEALADHVLANPDRYDTRQQAGAVHTADKAWGENVKMHQGLYSHNSASDQQLFDDMENKSLGSEQRAAAAGMLMQRGRATQNEAVRRAVSLAQSGDGAIGGIQKQMADDMGSRKPMGLGSGAAAELRRGMLGVNGEGKPPGTGTDYNFDEEIAKRAVGKVSAAGIPDMDPDDLQEVLKAAKAGRIQGKDLDVLHQNIATAKSDDRINNRIDDAARTYLDDISAVTKKDAQDAAASSYGPNI